MSITKEQKEKIEERLNNPDLDEAWKYLEDNYLIKKDSLSDEQKLYLSMGACTTLVNGVKADKYGNPMRYSLRLAYSAKARNSDQEKKSPDKILVIGLEVPKTIKNCLCKNEAGQEVVDVKNAKFRPVDGSDWCPLVLGDPNNPEDMKASCEAVRRLVEVNISYDGNKRTFNHIYANAGVVYNAPKSKDKTYLVSLNPFNNTFIGVPTKTVYKYMNSLVKLGGVEINDETKKNLANGVPVALKKGDDKFYQFDATKMRVVALPIEGIRLSMLTYLEESKTQEKTASEVQEKGKKTAIEGTTRKDAKAKSKKVDPVEEPKKKEKKGQKRSI